MEALSKRRFYYRKSIERGLFSIRDGCPVLIQGETGTGKEILARLIHGYSGRDKFIVVNPSEIPENLFEAELFGYKRGAFTDAKEEKIGLIESADCGTLFLDEVSDIPYRFQLKLLRVIETGVFRRLGETGERYSDFRLVCATNRDLRRLVECGEFRKDLYFRIKGEMISLPSLRDEPDEIFPLLWCFLEELRKNVVFSEEVRELKRFAELLPDSGLITLEDLPSGFFERHSCSYGEVKRKKTIIERVRCRKRKHLKVEIEEFLRGGGDIKGLCKELGCSRAEVYRILREVEIKADLSKGRPRKMSQN